MSARQSTARYRRTIDHLDREILTLAGRINAATYKLLVLIREFDERAGWMQWGFDNCARWLAYRCDLSASAAREKVRVANALKNLPKISAAFSTGELSYSKVRALSRVASPTTEASLCDFAMTTTAANVEERCRQLRNVQPESVHEANRVYAKRSLSIWRNANRGTMTITVELPIEQGELVAQALDKAAEQDVAEGPELSSETWHAKQADALVSLAMHHLRGSASGGTRDNYQVMIHVDESALTSGEGRSDLPIESVKRLTCDGSVIGLVEDADGKPLRLGRKRRTVSPAQRKALEARDKCCQFPGCTHSKYLEAHHIKHWANGGETNVDELVLTCPRHHRLVHEGGYTIEKDIEGRLFFRRPDGRAIPAQGYRREDMLDDEVAASAAKGFAQNTNNEPASAEARSCFTNDEPDSAEARHIMKSIAVREIGASYCVDAASHY